MFTNIQHFNHKSIFRTPLGSESSSENIHFNMKLCIYIDNIS